MGIDRARRAGLLAILAIACSIETERETILPWLELETTRSKLGGFDPSTQRTYFTRYWGFWKKLDVWTASVLDSEHALVQDEQGYGILRRGALTPIHVCPTLASLTLPGVGSAVDCVEAREHAAGGLVQIRARRIDPSGRMLAEWTLSVVGDRRIFPPPAAVLAYDEGSVPYFLIMDSAAALDRRIRPTDCALVAPGENESHIVLGGPEMSWEECRKPSSWEPLLQRRLRDAWSRP